MAILLWKRAGGPAGGGVPLPGQVISVILSLAAISVLSCFLTQRFLVIRVWSRLPFVVWLVFAIYIDSYAFVFATAILQHSLGVNSSIHICQGAILLCLVCYVTTKIFIYLFLVEKAYIIRGTTKRRMQSRFYLFNSFGMLGIYIVVVILNFIFRITRMEGGQCIIGMQSVAMIPLISFDAVVNIYLTIIFLIPLKNLYTFKNMARTPANMRLRTVAFRTFTGAVCTLVSSIANLSVLMALNGEPGWVCLMCCNVDILFSAVVIQWVTSKDNAGTSSTTSSDGRNGRVDANAPVRHNGLAPTDDHCTPPSTPAEISLVTSCRPRRESYDEHASKARQAAGAVVITTTIKRESKPNDHAFDTPASDDDEGPGYRGSQRMSCGPLATDGFVSSRTRITGGLHHH